MGGRKGNKKDVKILNVCRTSESMARDMTWGTEETRDGRQAYVPEAGQLDNDIPVTWANRLEVNRYHGGMG